MGPAEQTTYISVHMPKTAGMSFKAALAQHFAGRMLEDYADMPINHPVWRRRRDALWHYLRHGRPAPDASSPALIHGHFMPLKYRAYRQACFITWLRDPVERLASHYYYWSRQDLAASPWPLQQRMLKENWTLEQFCLAPRLRNFYSQFLWGFPLRRFAFIGISEDYPTELAWFARHILHRPLDCRQENRNLRNHDQRYITDPALRARIAAYHARDMHLYRWAREQQRARLEGVTDY